VAAELVQGHSTEDLDQTETHRHRADTAKARTLVKSEARRNEPFMTTARTGSSRSSSA